MIGYLAAILNDTKPHIEILSAPQAFIEHTSAQDRFTSRGDADHHIATLRDQGVQSYLPARRHNFHKPLLGQLRIAEDQCIAVEDIYSWFSLQNLELFSKIIR